MRRTKRILSLALSLAMAAALLPAALASAEGELWTSAYNEADGFYTVTNPGEGAKRLSVSDIGKIITSDGLAFKDLNGSGALDLYEDWRETPEARAQSLSAALDIDQIAPLMIASMHQSNVTNPASSDGLLNDGIRHILNAAGSAATAPQVQWMNHMQKVAESSTDMMGIPVDVFSDPRSNAGATDGFYDGSSSSVSKWPGSLGFGATFDPSNVELFGEIASKEYRALGITTALSPQIDLATEPRWTRSSGTYSESPELSSDIALAYTKGFQSTYGESGMVWGDESVAAMLKHWPGDGSGEGGRESHANVGKYAVYPGDNLEDHMKPFRAALDLSNLNSTAYAAAVMPSYSIGIAADGTPVGGDPTQLGSGVSPFKMKDTLYNEMGFDGYVCTDWGIAGTMSNTADGGFTDRGGGMAWGTGDLPGAERVWAGLRVGVDMYGGLGSTNSVRAAYRLAVEELGEEAASAHFHDSARRILLSAFRLGLFEDPYRSVDESLATVGSAEFNAAGFEVQLDSIIMLKNKGSVIAPAGEGKKTVYIPLAISRNSAATVVDQASAEAVFNVVTDEFVDGAIVRRTDFTGVDFALVKATSPSSPGDMFTGSGFDPQIRNVPNDILYTNLFGQTIGHPYDPSMPIDNGYFPKTVQYREYTADPDVVRPAPIAVDPKEEAIWVAAGQKAGMSRYYGGKSVTSTNEAQLDRILDTVAAVDGKIPVVVAMAANSPMVFNEFESQVDAIVLSFGTSDAAIVEVVSGGHEPSGLLPVQMPANMDAVEAQFEDVPFDMACHVDTEGNVYDFAFGLGFSGVIDDERVTAYAPERKATTLGVSAPALTKYGDDAAFTVGGVNMNDVNLVELTFDVDSTLLDVAEPAIAGVGGFSVFEEIRWTDLGSGKTRGNVILGAMTGVTVNGTADIATFAFDAGKLGVASFEIVGASVFGIDATNGKAGSNERLVIVLPANASTKVYSPYDINNDDKVDFADLSLAFFYYQAKSGDANWAHAQAADVDGDGDVDMTDLVAIYANFMPE